MSLVERESLVPINGAHAERAGLEIDDTVGFDDWAGMGEHLDAFSSTSTWWLADWVAVGRERYGHSKETAASFREVLDRRPEPYETLLLYGRVAETIRFETRIPSLTFSHHRAVYALRPEEREEWLGRAVANGWSVSQMRAHIGQAALASAPAEVTAVLQRISVGGVEPERAQRWRDAAERAERPFAEWAADALDQAAA